jgi:hypothetical protein
MKLKLILCKVLKHEVQYCLARCPNKIEIIEIEQGLHNTPEKLRSELQRQLDAGHDGFDAVLLGYGLCGNGALGLTCPIPLVIPRAHDCITLLLGSRRRHEEYSRQYPGSYIYTRGWIEESHTPSRQNDRALLEEYRQKYGDDNAAYLMEMQQLWRRQYRRAVFIDWELPDRDAFIQYTKDAADYLSWEFGQLRGDSRLLQNLLDGQWDERDFLVLPPGEPITQNIVGPCSIEFQK